MLVIIFRLEKELFELFRYEFITLHYFHYKFQDLKVNNLLVLEPKR